jgi:Planctomycete cytochrome C
MIRSPQVSHSSILRLVAFCLFLFTTDSAFAQPGNDNATRLEVIRRHIADAGELFKKKSFSDSGKKIRAAQALLERVLEDASEDDREILMKEYGRIAKAHELLQAENVTLPGLLPFPDKLGGDDSAGDQDKTGEDPSMPGEEKGNPSGDEKLVSFKSVVAPILVTHCGNCHVRGAQGEYSIRTFDALMAAAAGNSVVAGKPDESLLVTRIEDGSMPKRGPKVTPADLAKIRKWIEQGANFDGEDRTEQLKAGDNSPRPFR